MHSPYLTAPTPCAVYYMLLSYFLWALLCNSNPNCTLVKTQLPPLPSHHSHTPYMSCRSCRQSAIGGNSLINTKLNYFTLNCTPENKPFFFRLRPFPSVSISKQCGSPSPHTDFIRTREHSATLRPCLQSQEGLVRFHSGKKSLLLSLSVWNCTKECDE